jgi:hypothetical protein
MRAPVPHRTLRAIAGRGIGHACDAQIRIRLWLKASVRNWASSVPPGAPSTEREVRFRLPCQETPNLVTEKGSHSTDDSPSSTRSATARAPRGANRIPFLPYPVA